MAISQARSNRKETGSRYKAHKKESQYELGRTPSYTRLEKRRIKSVRTMGKNKKMKLLSTDLANVYDPKAKKYEKIKIKTIVETPANSQFTRRNIMTKGCVIETEKGKAKVTSRPGQDGTVNAVFVQ